MFNFESINECANIKEILDYLINEMKEIKVIDCNIWFTHQAFVKKEMNKQ